MEPPAPPPPPPPPPPSGDWGGGPTGAAAPFNVGDAVGYGWNVYWKNVGPLVVIALVVFAIQFVFSAIGNAVDSVGVQVVVQIVGILVSLLVTLGWWRVAVEITRGVKPEVGDLFKAQGYGTFIGASILFYIGAVIGLIFLIIPGIIFCVVFGFYGFVIAERGDGVSVTEAFGRSAEITRGHRWELFGLAIVLLLINVVGVLACLVGVLFTSGITLLAWAYAYRTLSGESVERDAWA
jgi:uncharacterized membrane protein